MNDKDKELLEWKEAARSEAEEVNRLQTENKKLREELETAKIIFREIEFDDAANDIEEALKEM
jgi:regulator of replication initiation timing